MIINIDSLNINYIDIGDSAGGELLLLHGWGTDIGVYKSITDFLGGKMRVAALDMPGFGGSDKPPCAWCVDDYVDLVGKFCKKIGLNDPVLLGHSFGGRVVIKAVTRKEPVLSPPKIILTDSAGIRPVQSFKAKAGTKMYKAGRAVMSTAPMKKLFPDAVENMRRKRGSADYLAAAPVMRETLVKVVNEDLSHLLPEIKQPTLLIWGENDDATPPSDGEKMEKLIKDSGLVKIKNAGHYSFLDDPYTYSRVLASFLNISL